MSKSFRIIEVGAWQNIFKCSQERSPIKIQLSYSSEISSFSMQSPEIESNKYWSHTKAKTN
jgi:hypothetical protein